MLNNKYPASQKICTPYYRKYLYCFEKNKSTKRRNENNFNDIYSLTNCDDIDNEINNLLKNPMNKQPNVIKIKLKNKSQDESNMSVPDISDFLKLLIGDINKDINKFTSTKIDDKIRKYDMNIKYTEIQKSISTIDDLLELSELYKNDPTQTEKYSFNIKKIFDMKDALVELKNMVGMESVKKLIVRQIVYFLQDIEEQQDMLHTIITGSPGTGKTSIGLILSKIYYSLGLLAKKKSINPISGKEDPFIFKIYKRSDLIGQYLGHTAIKTQKAIDDCIGGIMFLDEAYSLGHDEKSDIYTKECLDTINQNLSEKKNNFILIIAGYADQLEKCFFSHNEGLKRRFAFKYNIDKYSVSELAEMLQLKIKLSNWKLDEQIKNETIINLIKKDMNLFKNYGGDIESWFLQIKIEHGTRIFGKHPKYRKIITINDLENSLINFKNTQNNKYNLEINKNIINTMFI